MSFMKVGNTFYVLISDLLDLAKIESGKIELEPTEVCVPSFLDTVVKIIQASVQEKGLSLETDVAPDLPTKILADEKRLRQILLNLLSNAVKFTEGGTVTLWRCCQYPDERIPKISHLCFSVADTGIGIPPHQLQNVFQPFEQIQYTTSYGRA